MLNPSSRLKGEKDWQKYEKARKLKDKIDTIRENYMQDLKSKEMRVRQRAVALYFIGKLNKLLIIIWTFFTCFNLRHP
jgi:DNA topoisomerase-1